MSNSNVGISYIGWIDDKEKWVTLTWSCTLFELNVWWKKKAKVVIDAWMFQWAKGDNDANEEVDERILDADYLIVTHAHMDHTWRVPYLVKKWFKWKIIMSNLTQLQELAMWEDYVRLTKNEIERISNKNDKTRDKLKKAFFVISTIDSLNSEKITHKLKKLKKRLEELLWTKDFDSAYSESKSLIAEYKEKFWLESEKDIESVLDEVPTLLYDEKDIWKTVDYINVLETNEEYDLENFHPISSWKDDLIMELPKMVSNWFSERVPVLTYMKWTVISKLRHEWDKLKHNLDENERINEENAELSEKLTSAFNFVKWCKEHKANLEEFEAENKELLANTEKWINDEIRDLLYVNFKWSNRKVASIVDFYRKNYLKLPANIAQYWITKKELDNLWIEDESDINSVLPDLPWYNYDLSDIRKVLSSTTYVKDDFDISTFNYKDEILFINSTLKFNPSELLDICLNKRKKRIFIKESIKEYVIQKLSDFIENNRKNIALSNSLKQKLNNSLDLIEIYNWNHLAYLRKNRKAYLKAVNFISYYEYNPNNLKLPTLSESDLDEIINNYEKWNNTIHIKRVDDKRIYDILFSTSSNYYFEPKIRERVKEKLIDKIAEITLNIKKEKEKLDTYSKAVSLEKIYDAKLVLASLDEWNLTLEDARKILEENNIKSQNDIAWFVVQTTDLYSNSDITKFLKKINYINSEDELPNWDDFIYIESLDDPRFFEFRTFVDNKKIFLKHWILKKDIEELLKNHRNLANSTYKQEKDVNDSFKNLLYKAFSIVEADEYLKDIWITKEKYEEALNLLNEYSISSRKDVDKLNKYETFYPYSLKDLENFLKNISIVWDDFELKSSIDFIVIDSLDDERIYDLPYNYKDLTKVVYIKDSLKDDIKKKLLSWMWERYKMMSVRRKKRLELRKKYDWIKFMYENWALLFNLPDNKSPIEFYDELKERVLKIESLKVKLKRFKRVSELYENLKVSWDSKLQAFIEAEDFLKKYKINTLEDIDNVYKELHFIPYTLEDVEKAISLLKWVHIDKNETILESLKLRFFKAGHIEWSVQAVITVVVSEVDNVLGWKIKKIDVKTSKRRRLSHKNFWVSWDWWRLKDPNIAWSPEVPNIDWKPLKLDYWQMESTYAGRLHPDKQKSIDELVSAISNAPWKVLIPAFSMQRTQEILMILLERMLDSRINIDEIRKINSEIYELRSKIKWISKSVSDLDALEMKSVYQEEINELEEKLRYYKYKIFDYDIILDSPLSQKITEIYLSKLWAKYNFLNSDTQIKLFWRERIKILEKSDWYKELYTEERKNKKEIVLSASWMCDWWAITSHLKEILPNSNATIAFVWYCPSNTRWWKIKAKEEYIPIDQKPYELNCEIVDIWWFSWHPDEEEIITYLSELLEYNKWAQIALTHWWEAREELAPKVKKAIKSKKWQVINIIKPKLGDTVTISL